jgi:hypothetical protein
MYIVEKPGEKCGREKRGGEQRENTETLCELKSSVMVLGDGVSEWENTKRNMGLLVKG